jgi:hypothetical protein
MLRRLLISLFITLIFFNFGCVGMKFVPRAEAIAPIVGAAVISIEALEGLQMAVLAAASVGIVSTLQKKEFQASLNSAMRAIQNKLDSAYSLSHDAYLKVTKTLRRAPSSVEAKQSAPGECDPSLRSNPRKCCKDFMNRFEGGNGLTQRQFMVPAGNASWQVFDSKTGELKCCVNWDEKHGRFELFHPGGEGKYRPNESGDAYSHKGELTCADRKSEFVCGANLYSKADNSGKHSPREGCRNLHGNSSEHGNRTPRIE